MVSAAGSTRQALPRGQIAGFYPDGLEGGEEYETRENKREASHGVHRGRSSALGRMIKHRRP